MKGGCGVSVQVTTIMISDPDGYLWKVASNT